MPHPRVHEPAGPGGRRLRPTVGRPAPAPEHRQDVLHAPGAATQPSRPTRSGTASLPSVLAWFPVPLTDMQSILGYFTVILS